MLHPFARILQFTPFFSEFAASIANIAPFMSQLLPGIAEVPPLPAVAITVERPPAIMVVPVFAE